MYLKLYISSELQNSSGYFFAHRHKFDPVLVYIEFWKPQEGLWSLMDCVHTEGDEPMEDKTVCVCICV